MQTTNFVALVVGLLLTAAAFLAIYHDARHGNQPPYLAEFTHARFRPYSR